MMNIQHTNTRVEDMREALVALGYQPIHLENLSDPIDFYIFEQFEQGIQKLIIATHYHEPLNLKNIKPLFNEAHDLLMDYVHRQPELKVAFLVLLSRGVSPSIMVIRAFTEPIIRIQKDIDLKPTVIYSPHKTGLRFLETLAKLIRGFLKSNDLDFDEKYHENTVEAAHKRAIKLAK
jgi:hypothetical protein